jgi:hypothetical protein
MPGSARTWGGGGGAVEPGGITKGPAKSVGAPRAGAPLSLHQPRCAAKAVRHTPQQGPLACITRSPVPVLHINLSLNSTERERPPLPS